MFTCISLNRFSKAVATAIQLLEKGVRVPIFRNRITYRPVSLNYDLLQYSDSGGDMCWTAQIMLSNCSTKRIHPEKSRDLAADSEQIFSFMIVYFADTPTGFLGRDDGTEDGSGGAGRGGKDGMKDAVALCDSEMAERDSR